MALNDKKYHGSNQNANDDEEVQEHAHNNKHKEENRGFSTAAATTSSTIAAVAPPPAIAVGAAVFAAVLTFGYAAPSLIIISIISVFRATNVEEKIRGALGFVVNSFTVFPFSHAKLNHYSKKETEQEQRQSKKVVGRLHILRQPFWQAV